MASPVYCIYRSIRYIYIYIYIYIYVCVCVCVCSSTDMDHPRDRCGHSWVPTFTASLTQWVRSTCQTTCNEDEWLSLKEHGHTSRCVYTPGLIDSVAIVRLAILRNNSLLCDVLRCRYTQRVTSCMITWPQVFQGITSDLNWMVLNATSTHVVFITGLAWGNWLRRLRIQRMRNISVARYIEQIKNTSCMINNLATN